MNTIDRTELKQHIDHGDHMILVDALPKDSFAKNHLPGAISIPAEDVKSLAPKMLDDKDQLIVTYCASAKCPKSRMAAEALEKLGYTNVMAYEGGIDDWQKAGLPLESAGVSPTRH